MKKRRREKKRILEEEEEWREEKENHVARRTEFKKRRGEDDRGGCMQPSSKFMMDMYMQQSDMRKEISRNNFDMKCMQYDKACLDGVSRLLSNFR